MGISRVVVPLFVLMLLVGGCAHKNLYEPVKVAGRVSAPHTLPKRINHVVRTGAMLGNNTVISQKSGKISGIVPKGFHFINESDGKIIVADNDGNLRILDPKNRKTTFIHTFSQSVISATLQKNLLALMLADNTIVLYDIEADRERYREALGKVIAIDARAANPLFINDLIVFPTLDGRLLIMDSNKKMVLRDVAISDKELFNNVIFLQVHNNVMVAATASKVVVITPKNIYTYSAEIKDILYLGHDIYLFTKSGKVIHLNERLQKVHETAFEFANFVAVAEMNGKLYGVEKNGYLIEMDRKLGNVRVRRLDDEVEAPVIIARDKLYIGDKEIQLP